MKKAVKIILCIAAVLAGLVIAFCVWWYMGVDLEKRYKALFDKTFGGNYTITVTDSGTYTAEEALFRIPSKYKDYDVKYFDRDGSERHFDISNRLGLGEDMRSVMSTVLNRGRYLDLYLIADLEYESSKIFLDQLRKSLKEYYGEGLKKDGENLGLLMRMTNGEGCDINIFSQNCNFMTLYEDTYNDIVFSEYSRRKIAEAVSPETCAVLSEQDIRSYAKNEGTHLGVVVSLRNKKSVKKAEQFKENTEALVSDFAEMSGFGGNYYYIVQKDKDPADDVPAKTLYEKEIIFGKPAERENEDDVYSTVLKKAILQREEAE